MKMFRRIGKKQQLHFFHPKTKARKNPLLQAECLAGDRPGGVRKVEIDVHSHADDSGCKYSGKDLRKIRKKNGVGGPKWKTKNIL